MIEVELPDGTVAEFPDGTPREAITSALAKYKAPSKPTKSYLDSLKSGAADSTIRTVLGVKQFFGGLSDEDKGVLREMKADAEADPNSKTRTAGGIAADIAMTAIPGSKLEGALKGAKTASRLRNTLVAMGSSGALDAITQVGEGNSYGQQMADKLRQGALSAGMSGMLSGALNAISKPFRSTADANTLFQQGVNPTLQQAADTKWGRFVGGLAAGVGNPGARQHEELANAWLRRATEGNVSAPQGTGKEIAGLAEDYVQGQYGDLFKGKRFPLKPSALREAAQAAQELNKRGQFADEATEAGRAVANVFGPGELNTRNVNINYDTLRNNYLTPLREAANTSSGPAVRDRIKTARDVIIDQVRNPRLSPEELERLKTVDVLNYDVNRMKEAVRGAAGEKDGVTLGRLAGAYGKAAPMDENRTMQELLGPALRTIGENPLQQQARTEVVTARRVLPALGIATAGGYLGGLGGVGAGLGGLYGLSALGQYAGGAKALTGNTDIQRKLAEMLRNRNVIGPAVSTLYNEEYNDVP